MHIKLFLVGFSLLVYYTFPCIEQVTEFSVMVPKCLQKEIEKYSCKPQYGKNTAYPSCTSSMHCENVYRSLLLCTKENEAAALAKVGMCK